MKQIKNFIWILLVIAQTVLGTGAGLLLLSFSKAEPEIANTSVGDISLRGLTLAEAEEIISDYYKDQIKNGQLVIEIDGSPFAILYSDIDVVVDIQKTIETLEKNLPKDGLDKLFSDSEEAYELLPVFTYNSGKLLKRCEELFSHYEKEPVDESYTIRNGALDIIPAEPGVKVNYEYLEQELKGLFFTKNGPLKIFTDSSQAFIKTSGEHANNEQFTVLVSSREVIIDSSAKNIVEKHSKSLQSLIVDNGQEFSLKSVLDFSEFIGDSGKDLLSRMATAIYQAALPLEGVRFTSRLPAKMPVSYSDPGYEAVIDGEGADLVMKNDTGRALMLLSETKDDVFKVYIVSSGEIKKGTLTSEKRDEVKPAVITIVNSSLPPNETRVVSEGVPGFTIYVFRTIDGVVEELYHDKYQPISKTVEQGEKPASPSTK